MSFAFSREEGASIEMYFTYARMKIEAPSAVVLRFRS